LRLTGIHRPADTPFRPDDPFRDRHGAVPDSPRRFPETTGGIPRVAPVAGLCHDSKKAAGHFCAGPENF